MLEKFQCSSALLNIKCNCVVLFLVQLYWLLSNENHNTKNGNDNRVGVISVVFFCPFHLLNKHKF